MVVQSPPSYLQNASHSAALFRQAIAATWLEGGPVLPNELWVAAQSTPNMSVQVGAGRAVIQGSQASAPGLLPSGSGLFTSQAVYVALNDAAVTVTISAADPTNPRIDVVYIAVQDSFYSGSNNQALVGVVTGVPAASPAVPAAPANAEILAQVSVAANATSITNGNITNRVSPATPIGQPVPVDTYAHLQLWSPLRAGTYADVYADTAANGGLYRWSGSGWVHVSTGGRVAFTPSWTNLVPGSGTVTAWYSIEGGFLTGAVNVTFGSGYAVGTGPKFTLPVPIAVGNATGTSLGTGLMVRSGVAYYSGQLINDASGSAVIFSVGAGASLNSVQYNSPNTWQIGDNFSFTFSYPV